MAELVGITQLPDLTVVEPPLTVTEAGEFEDQLNRHQRALHALFLRALANRGIALTDSGTDKDNNRFYLAKWNDMKYIAVYPEEG